MARTFLKHSRVKSVDELKERILKGIAEFNATPVVFRWNKFDLGVPNRGYDESERSRSAG